MGLMRRVHTAANMFVDGIRRFARGRLLPPAADGKLGIVGHEYDARFEAFARERGRTVPQIALQFLAGATGVQTILAGMSTQRHLDGT
jgi:aryl-alcohol dehydrogenase-like predicted oxidoreductase